MRRVNFAEEGQTQSIKWNNFKGVNIVDDNTNLPVYQVPYAKNVDFSRYIGAASKRRGLEALITSLGAGGIKGFHTYKHSSGDRILFGHETNCYKLSGATTNKTLTSQADWAAGTLTQVNHLTPGDLKLDWDQSSSATDVNINSGTSDKCYVTSTNPVGQTFTTGASVDNLRSIQFSRVHCGTWDNETITLSIWDSPSKNTLLGTSVKTSGGSITVIFKFSPVIPVSPSTQYYMELTHSGDGDNSVGFIYYLSNPYAEGQMYQNGVADAANDLAMVTSYCDIGYYTSGSWLSPVYDLTNTPIISTLSWTQTTPSGTSVSWYARGSTDNQNWGDWQTVAVSGNGIPLTRYVQIMIELAGDTSATPTVSDFTITYETSFTQATSIKSDLTGNRIRFADWNNKCWFTEGGRPQVYNGTSVRNVGVDPPSTAPTLAASGSGSFNGTYKAKVTFVNEDGAESNACTGEGSVTATNAAQFDWSDIPTGDTSITSRKLWRTKAGGDVFYLVATLNDNTTTTYTDTVADTSLTTELKTDNDIPPNSSIIYEHKNYMFYVPYADPTKLYYSKVGLPDSVPGENFEQFPYEILGLRTYADQLIVCGEHFTKAISGSIFDPDPTVGNYSIRDIDSIGAMAHEAMAECIEPEFRNILLFPVKTGIKFLTPGLQEKSLEAVPISRNVQPYFVDAKRKDYMAAIFHDNCYFIAFNWYDSSETPVGYNNCVSKMDMRTREWSGIWTINCAGFCVANGQLYIADSTIGQIYLHTGSSDNGSPIDMILDSSYVGSDEKRKFKKLRLHVKKGSNTASTVITTRADDLEGTINVGANTTWAGYGGSSRTVQDELTSPEFTIPSARGYNFGWRIEDNSTNDVVIYGVTVRAEPPS